jgi:hypothetical protein
MTKVDNSLTETKGVCMSCAHKPSEKGKMATAETFKDDTSISRVFDRLPITREAPELPRDESGEPILPRGVMRTSHQISVGHSVHPLDFIRFPFTSDSGERKHGIAQVLSIVLTSNEDVPIVFIVRVHYGEDWRCPVRKATWDSTDLILDHSDPNRINELIPFHDMEVVRVVARDRANERPEPLQSRAPTGARVFILRGALRPGDLFVRELYVMSHSTSKDLLAGRDVFVYEKEPYFRFYCGPDLAEEDHTGGTEDGYLRL